MHYHTNMITHGWALLNQLSTLVGTGQQQPHRIPPLWNKQIVPCSNLDGQFETQIRQPLYYFPNRRHFCHWPVWRSDSRNLPLAINKFDSWIPVHYLSSSKRKRRFIWKKFSMNWLSNLEEEKEEDTFFRGKCKKCIFKIRAWLCRHPFEKSAYKCLLVVTHRITWFNDSCHLPSAS